MSSTIGATKATLTANSSGFTAAYKAAESGLKSFAKTSASVAGGMAAFEIGKAVAQKGYQWTVGLTEASLEAIDNNGKLADRLGLSTEALVGLQHAGNLAGTSSEQLTGALEKMLKSLGGVSEEGDLTKDVFARLGLSVSELANGPADQAFSKIAQKISEIQNPTEQATVAMKIFGKAGQSLLPLINSGAEGLAAASEEAKKLGLSYSRVDASKVEAANDAMTKVGELAVGVGNQFAIGLAPYITAAADQIVEFTTAGGGISAYVAPAIELVAQGIAYAADTANLLRAGFNLIQAGAGIAIAGTLLYVDQLGSGLSSLLNLLPGVEVEWTSTFKDIGTAMRDGALEDVHEAATAWSDALDGKASKSVDAFFAKVRDGADSAAKAAANAGKRIGQLPEDMSAAATKSEETLKKLREDVATFGLSKSEKAIADVQQQGGTEAQQAEAGWLTAQLEQLQQVKKQHEEAEQAAKAYYEGALTPAEKYAAEVEKINGLLAEGAFDDYGGQDAADAALAKAKADYEKEANGDTSKAAETPQGPSLLQAGSSAAANFVASFRNGNTGLPEQQLAEAKKQSSSLDQIARNTATRTPGGGGLDPVTDF